MFSVEPKSRWPISSIEQKQNMILCIYPEQPFTTEVQRAFDSNLYSWLSRSTYVYQACEMEKKTKTSAIKKYKQKVNFHLSINGTAVSLLGLVLWDSWCINWDSFKAYQRSNVTLSLSREKKGESKGNVVSRKVPKGTTHGS